MKKSMLFIVLILTMALFVGCKIKKVSDCEKYFNESMNNVTSVNTNMTMTDNNVVVYEFIKDVKFTDSTTCTVESVKKELGDSFTLEDKEKETQTLTNVDKKSLSMISFDEDYFDEYELKNNVLTITVSASNFMKVLNNAQYIINGNANIVITYENKNVTSVVITFITNTNKNVVITTTYSY